MIQQYDQWTPKLGEKVFIADTAQVIGNVQIGKDSSIFFQSVVRADFNSIQIGQETNVQDLCCLHVSEDFPCVIGDCVVIGHRCVIHGCEIEDNVLIGIGSIILNGAKIGHGSIIGAGALVPEGKCIPPYSLVFGIPGQVVRQVSEEQARNIKQMAKTYIQLKNNYLANYRVNRISDIR